MGRMKSIEMRAGAIVIITALLWFTDFAHGLHPAVPAMIALCLILMPAGRHLDLARVRARPGLVKLLHHRHVIVIVTRAGDHRRGGLVLRHAGGDSRSGGL